MLGIVSVSVEVASTIVIGSVTLDRKLRSLLATFALPLLKTPILYTLEQSKFELYFQGN